MNGLSAQGSDTWVLNHLKELAGQRKISKDVVMAYTNGAVPTLLGRARLEVTGKLVQFVGVDWYQLMSDVSSGKVSEAIEIVLH